MLWLYMNTSDYTNSNNGKSLCIDVLHFSHHRAFKNEHNACPKMSVKRTLDSLCSSLLAVLFTFADERYSWSSISFWCHLVYIILFPRCFKIIYRWGNLTNTVIIYLLCFQFILDILLWKGIMAYNHHIHITHHIWKWGKTQLSRHELQLDMPQRKH